MTNRDSAPAIAAVAFASIVGVGLLTIAVLSMSDFGRSDPSIYVTFGVLLLSGLALVVGAIGLGTRRPRGRWWLTAGAWLAAACVVYVNIDMRGISPDIATVFAGVLMSAPAYAIVKLTWAQGTAHWLRVADDPGTRTIPAASWCWIALGLLLGATSAVDLPSGVGIFGTILGVAIGFLGGALRAGDGWARWPLTALGVVACFKLWPLLLAAPAYMLQYRQGSADSPAPVSVQQSSAAAVSARPFSHSPGMLRCGVCGRPYWMRALGIHQSCTDSSHSG